MKKTNFGLLAVALCLTPLGKANIIYTFSMNTTPLVGNGPFTLDLQFLDGSGLPVDLNNNTVALTNFAFGAGGSPSGGGTVTGGASGSLASGVTLTDTAFFNEYFEGFTPGALLSFTIDSTNVPDPGGTPDLLTVAILDSSFSELLTTGPASEFLDFSLAGGATPQVSTFASAPGSGFFLAAPTVQVATTSPVPEPSSYWELLTILLAWGFAGKVLRSRRIGGSAGSQTRSRFWTRA
jgi:hypothetical protein